MLLIKIPYISRAMNILRNEGIFQLLSSGKSYGANRTRRIRERTFKYVISPTYNRVKYWFKYQKAAPRSNRLIYVNPTKVEYLLTPHFWKRVSRYTTHVRNGKWDKSHTNKKVVISGRHEGINTPCLVPFDNFVFYTSCKDHFLKNVPWKETELYRLLLQNKNHYWKYYDTKRNIHESLERVDKIYYSIKNNGYLHQKEIAPSPYRTLRDSKYTNNYHEVAVNIGRDGEIIFDDGRHRFVTAKILQIPNIPVRVLVRHKKWQEIRNEIAKASSPEELSRRAHSHLGHPDLFDVTPESWL